MKKLKIVDFSTLIPGPFASYLILKHLEAEVIKYEEIINGDPLINLRPTKEGKSLAYLGLNSGKKIKKFSPQNGIMEALEDIRRADILIENYKPGRAEKIGLGFGTVKKVNPSIIYCSVTGFPSGHPLKGKAAHDLNVLALCGYLDMEAKLKGRLDIPSMQLADIFTAYSLTLKVLSAKVQDVRGVHLEVSIFQSMKEAMFLYNYPQLVINKDINPDDFIMSGILPCYALYPVKDGYVAVAALEKALWVDFCSEIKRNDLIGRQFEKTAYEEVKSVLRKTRKSQWLKKGDFCVTPVLSIIEARKLKYV